MRKTAFCIIALLMLPTVASAHPGIPFLNKNKAGKLTETKVNPSSGTESGPEAGLAGPASLEEDLKEGQGFSRVDFQRMEDQAAELADLRQMLADQQAELAAKDSLLADQSTRLDNYEVLIVKYVQEEVFRPCNTYVIEKLAIPAFTSMQGRERYEKYKGRMERVANYNSDLRELDATLTRITEKGRLRGTESLVQADSREAIDRITSLPAYKDYQQTYGASRPKPVFLDFADRALAILKSQPFEKRREKILALEAELAQTLK